MRDVPYEPNERCDNCGRLGAFDFMGDLLCPKCIQNEDDIEELEEEEDDTEEEE